MQDIFRQNYEALNSKQKEVVDEIYGPIMVIAGPGTGKTQIIALRTANIIEKAKVNPENILISTFTEAGVIAIKNRLLKFLGTDAHKIKVSTIHSFSADIISGFPEKFVEYRTNQTIDEIESLEVLTKIMDDFIKNDIIKELFSPYDRYFYLRDIFSKIAVLKSEGISNNTFDEIIEKQRQYYNEKIADLQNNKRIRDLEKRIKQDSETYLKHINKLKELNIIYKEYQAYLKQNSLYDFSDMINFVVEKLKNDNDLRLNLSEKYQFIMLDEYQDTNNPQNEIINLLLSENEEKNIMVVGDDDQSIYRFQGANIENMLDFGINYQETKNIVLENNYRSSQSILDLSLNLIENNSARLVNKIPSLEKKLIAESPYKTLEKNYYFILQDEQLEKLFVLEEIKKKQEIEEKGNFAIICRSNREVGEWTNFMQLNGISVESKLKTNILNNKFVQFILDFLALVNNPNYNDEKFLNILRTDLIDIENIDVLTLARKLYQKNYSKNGFKYSLWEYIKNIDYVQISPQSSTFEKIGQKESHKRVLKELELESEYKNFSKIIEFRKMILELNSLLGNYGISVLFSKIIEKLGIIQYIEEKGNFSDLEDVFTLFNKIKFYNEKNPDLTIKELIDKFDLHKKYNKSIERQILKKTSSNIEILTAHGSKGLEYDYVFIPGVYAGNWENKRVADKLKLPFGIVGKGLQFSDLDEKQLKDIDKQISLEEDRRLFFVAMTRAKKELIFTRALGKDRKIFIDSPFITEIGIQGQFIEKQIDEQKIIDSIKNTLVQKDNLFSISKDEINYIKEFLSKDYRLSASDLNTFLEDPKVFLQNVIFKYPFTGNEFTIFGNVYHKVLENAFLKKINHENIELGTMTEEFLKLLNMQVLTNEEKNRLTQKGLEGLTGYYPYFINSKRTTLEVEYNFRSKNIVFEGIPITGKIDKIEKIDISSQASTSEDKGQINMFVENIAIVDYKTGKIKTISDIKGIDRYGNKKDDFKEGKYYRQLLFYKLLAENDRDFHQKYNITELALDFVEGRNGEYKYVTVDFSLEDYEEFKLLVKESWKKINDLEFWESILRE